ncbi:hypothetical protein [Candidatus Halobonum tyrrellensis]|uniref:Uncharacterized protein n=1 Tax=Candidatus Halobonum tyrrellensis G22 TaxID=1324957 RepID=V4J354_9EURY|nr:hypothetical protein [Candidatus Halobonum tyrrellensis]ESP89812.1 hypothetical protein K933_02476 [Candidatus Halobonum tyrrellensis G22]
MSLSNSSLRSVALVGLLVVGVVCSFAFHAALTSMDITYTATAVQPGENPDRVARASSDVVDLDERLSGTPEAARRPVERAAVNGSFAGNVAPELSITLDDLEAPSYAVYDGQYYDWNLTASEETTYVRIEMVPVDAETVVANISSSYDGASPEVQTAVDSGSVAGWSVGKGVYRRGGTYYAVAPESDTALAERLLGGFVGFVLTPVGRGYIAVALGVLGLRYRGPLADRPLTVRRAIGVAALAVPVSLVGTLLFESGSASRFVTGPASATLVASGVVAGVLAHQRRWLALVGFTVLIAVLTVVAISIALGLVGVLLGGVMLFVGFGAGLVPFAYGAGFGRDRSTRSA